ncbi:hypothetical protein AAVH_42098 [Aphelenchoides avenae]|nr:hypothetical protein AAVH_42098 [Aphelenchus avenae]
MDRVVKRLYGKLYMGAELVPHYYVQFHNSENLEFVRCNEVAVSNAQKIAFDANFEADERRIGRSGRVGAVIHQKNSKKLQAATPLSALNCISGEKEDREDDEDAYESSFIHDSTPSIHSSSYSSDEPRTSKTAFKTTKTRKRVVLDSDDELSCEPSRSKIPPKARKQALSTKENLSTTASHLTESRRTSKYTPLIILGTNTNAMPLRSSSSSPEIPVVTLDE